jgi:hypothetical protein
MRYKPGLNRRLPGLPVLATLLLLASCSSAGSMTIASSPPTSAPPITTGTTTTPAADAVIRLSAEPAAYQAGDDVTITLLIKALTAYRGAQWSLSFDPSAWRCESAEEGTFFKNWAAANGGMTLVFPQPVINNQAGKVTDMGIAIMASAEGGPSGEGLIGIYRFTALKTGVPLPDIVKPRLADPQGNLQNVIVENTP